MRSVALYGFSTMDQYFDETLFLYQMVVEICLSFVFGLGHPGMPIFSSLKLRTNVKFLLPNILGQSEAVAESPLKVLTVKRATKHLSVLDTTCYKSYYGKS